MIELKQFAFIGKTYRHIKRYRRIIKVLVKYGFSEIVDSLDLASRFKIRIKEKRPDKKKIREYTRPERLRMALDELGPTFIKLGQILSTRPDLIPWKYVKELSRLQDRVSPFEYEKVKTIIEEELGDPPEEVFKNFEREPIGAASLAQVHRGKLKDGTEVAVKIQRPEIDTMVEVDLDIMRYLAGLIEKHSREVQIQKPVKVVDEFAKTLNQEMSYDIESTYIDRFKRQFKDDERVYIIDVMQNYSTDKVLTMEFVEGIKSSNIEKLKKGGYDLELTGKRIAELMMEQIFFQGFFHADPHPANIYVIEDNKICYLDFGMMGRLNRRERESLTELFIQLVKKNERRMVESLFNITDKREQIDRDELERDVAEFMDRYLYKSLEHLEFGKMSRNLIGILTRHGLSLRPNMFLVIKTLSGVESLCRDLNPDFSLMDYLKPVVKKVYYKRFYPGRILEEGYYSLKDIVSFIGELPGELRVLLKKLKKGEVKIQFEHTGLKPLIDTLEHTSNRIAFSIVLASLIVGSSVIVLSDIPPRWFEIPVIGLAGYCIAGVMGFWLLISILTSGRM